MKTLVGGCALSLFLVAGAALGQTSAEVLTAREIAKQGIEAFDAGDYEEAAAQLGKAYGVVKVPTIALFRARALAKLGRLVEASELYHEASTLQVEMGQRVQQEQAQRAAKAEREELMPRIPKLTVRVEGAELGEVSFRLDDAEVPAVLLEAGHAVDPGEHTLTGQRGDEVATQSVSLEEGARETVTLRFEGGKRGGAGKGRGSSTGVPVEDQGAARSWQRPTGYALLGLGGVGLVVGTISAVGTKNKRGDLLDTGCDDDGACFADQQDDVDAYNRSLRTTNVGFVAGGVLAAAGATLVLVAPRRPAEGRRWAPWIGAGSAGVKGTF